MKAMILKELSNLTDCEEPLALVDVPDPQPSAKEVLLEISACGICHTELDEIEGRTPPPRLPIILGHQVVGRVVALGAGATQWETGDRLGAAWIYSACGKCKFCRRGSENLCGEFHATGRDANGGYAQYMTLREDFAFAIPEAFSDVEAAPLLCAGAIGYRSLRLTGLRDGQRLGLTGFGASGHLVIKMVRHRFPHAEVFVFARSEREQQHARQLGAVWSGNTEDTPPARLDCIIDTTPAFKPVVEALRNLEPGGRLVINAIRKEDVDKDYLLRLDYPDHLWMEKEIKTVANVTRADVNEFLELAAEMRIQPDVQAFPLADANQALRELKAGQIRGAKVLAMK